MAATHSSKVTQEVEVDLEALGSKHKSLINCATALTAVHRMCKDEPPQILKSERLESVFACALTSYTHNARYAFLGGPRNVLTLSFYVKNMSKHFNQSKLHISPKLLKRTC